MKKQSERRDPASADTFEIANEFANVVVTKVRTRNGERLKISSPKLDREILLCPLECESITWQTADVFSKFLSTPFGPGDDE
ncbi:MAG TPA: hypothetical protein VMV92_37105 [Streptosporangiaceae bacterium]|nr:hypothetical protein [Streptosporangiaceae bacterium]